MVVWCNYFLPSEAWSLWNSDPKDLSYYTFCLCSLSNEKSPHPKKQQDGAHTHTYSSVHRPQPCFIWLDVEPPNPNLNPFCSDLIPRRCFTRGSSPVQNNSFSFSESFSGGPDLCGCFAAKAQSTHGRQNVRIRNPYHHLFVVFSTFRTEPPLPSSPLLSPPRVCVWKKCKYSTDTLHDGSRTFRNAFPKARRYSRLAF